MIYLLTALVVGLAGWAWRLRAVTAAGAVTGAAMGMILALSATPAPLVAFLVFVALGSAASRLGAAEKRVAGVMQADDGRRGVEHALANCGFSVAVVAAAWCWPAWPQAEWVACASLAAAFSDTMASEIGTWQGGVPRDILRWKRVPTGQDGGVTAGGLAAAALASGGLAALTLPWLGASAFMPIAIGGFVGNLVDSILGATIEPRLGPRGGSIVNVVCCVTGGAAAAFLARVTSG
ncbi:MAG: DUF92 domain-containing protein [Planctomycetes bacterium]|nr:DUF92 domain-containing protein [Planctomycetota bacterium]